jgi:hypothetical protein
MPLLSWLALGDAANEVGLSTLVAGASFEATKTQILCFTAPHTTENFSNSSDLRHDHPFEPGNLTLAEEGKRWRCRRCGSEGSATPSTCFDRRRRSPGSDACPMMGCTNRVSSRNRTTRVSSSGSSLGRGLEPEVWSFGLLSAFFSGPKRSRAKLPSQIGAAWQALTLRAIPHAVACD